MTFELEELRKFLGFILVSLGFTEIQIKNPLEIVAFSIVRTNTIDARYLCTYINKFPLHIWANLGFLNEQGRIEAIETDAISSKSLGQQFIRHILQNMKLKSSYSSSPPSSNLFFSLSVTSNLMKKKNMIASLLRSWLTAN